MNQTIEPRAQAERWQNRFETVLARQLPGEDTHPQILHQAMAYSALAGGKRLRPLLVYATGTTLGLEDTQVDGIATAIELIHAYSLIHDDLPAMDDDDLRRGQPTCHKAFDEATAILAGDALQAMAFEILALDPELHKKPESQVAIIAQIAHACGSTGMAGGQAVDLAAVGQKLDQAALEQMHRLKTGALIKACTVAPALMAGASSETIKHLDHFGECLGLAFQIHDDILDVTGDSQVIGKSTQADEFLDKPTFPSIIGLQASIDRAQQLHGLAIQDLEYIQGDTDVLSWLADYVISRDR